MQDVITENEQAKVSDIFSYFQNRMTISCSYETLFDFHQKQASDGFDLTARSDVAKKSQVTRVLAQNVDQ
jgi:hypothetical protein